MAVYIKPIYITFFCEVIAAYSSNWKYLSLNAGVFNILMWVTYKDLGIFRNHILIIFLDIEPKIYLHCISKHIPDILWTQRWQSATLYMVEVILLSYHYPIDDSLKSGSWCTLTWNLTQAA